MKSWIKLILFPIAACGCISFTILVVFAAAYTYVYEDEDFKEIRFRKVIVDEWISIIPFRKAI